MTVGAVFAVTSVCELDHTSDVHAESTFPRIHSLTKHGRSNARTSREAAQSVSPGREPG